MRSAGSASSPINLQSVPDIPALTALNATGNKVDRPASASGLATSLANVIDATGAVKSGIGIEISPHALGVDRKWSYFEYQRDWWRRTLAQSALSVGTVRTSATPAMASADTKAAVGLRLVLWDPADPLLDSSYVDATRSVRAGCAGSTTPQATADCEVAAFARYNRWKAVPWNAGGLFIAAAQIWDFASGSLDSHRAETLSSWLAASVAISDWGQLTLGGVWDHGWHATSDKLAGALRLRVGATRYHFTADGTWNAIRDMDGAYGKWTAGAELELTNGVWLTVSAGADLGGMSSQKASLLSGVNWGFSKAGPK